MNIQRNIIPYDERHMLSGRVVKQFYLHSVGVLDVIFTRAVGTLFGHDAQEFRMVLAAIVVRRADVDHLNTHGSTCDSM